MKRKQIRQTLKLLDTLPVPDKEKILAACPQAIPTEVRQRPQLHRFSPRKVVVLAMAALLLVGGGVTVAAAEAKAYGEAIDFFEQYNLSAEGFTRSEVRQIYKDIVSESFTYEKTEEALASGLEGYEIQAAPLDSEGLKRVWMLGYVWKTEGQSQTVEENVEYHISHGSAANIGETDTLQKSKNGEHVWSIYMTDVFADFAQPIGNGVVVAGHPRIKTIRQKNAYIMRVYLLNDDSTEVWCRDFESSLPNPTVDYILCENDTITLFAVNPPYEYMWIVKLDMEGNLIHQEVVENNCFFNGLEKVVSVGEDYLMIKGNGKGESVLMQKKGNKIQNTVTFGNGDEDYLITDMIEFNGLIYLSGRMIPKYHNQPGGNAYDQFVEAHSKDGITDEEVSQFFLENHTAVLMICDPNSGEPTSFYTIPGAAGDALSVKDDRLTWNVNRYTGAKNFDMNYYLTSGCLGEITADKWQYVFSPYGQVVGEKDTGKMVQFEG